jgi:hypothetical protein
MISALIAAAWLGILSTPSGAEAEPAPTVLASDVAGAVPLDSTTVLCATVDHSWFTIDVRTGERRDWSPSWVPEDAGWIDDGFTFMMGRSPDGTHLFLSRGVLLPDSYEIPDGMWGMRSAVVFVICSPDGSGAYPALTSIAVGGGPEFAFTSDSRYLVGSPVLCPGGDPGVFSRYLSGEDDHVFFDRIEVATGEPSIVEGLEISDGFWKCPWSDWLRVENNWYGEHTFSNLSSGGIAGTYTVPGGEGCINGWVLDDAVLMSPPSGQGLLYVDGTFVETPSEGWDIYCRLDDGTFVYSVDGGITVLHGEVNWAAFEAGPSEVLEGLEGYMHLSTIPMPGSKGFLLTDFWDANTIWYCSLPGSG